jgi:hypothetical protein
MAGIHVGINYTTIVEMKRLRSLIASMERAIELEGFEMFMNSSILMVSRCGYEECKWITSA